MDYHILKKYRYTNRNQFESIYLPDIKMNWHYIMILKFMVFHAFHSQLPKF